MRHWRSCLAFVVTGVAISGCSWRGGDVSGTVKIGGKVVSSGSVIIQDEKGRSSIGVINKDGSYSVVGPPKGSCKVLLVRMRGVDANTLEATPDPNKKQEPEFPIPMKYANAKTSDIEIIVTSTSQTFNIERDDKLDFSPSPGGAPGGSNIVSGGAGRTQGNTPKAPGTGKPAGPGMPAGSGMPGMPKK
jgi:hypothetical protein